LFNYGRMRRDFTYVDDVIEAVERLIAKPPTKTAAGPGNLLDPARSAAPWRIYNIGNNSMVEISRLVELLEQELGCKAKTELVPMQPGDVPETCADVDDLMRDVGFRPATPIEDGVRRFVAWYREFHW
jgi:UDP-glucuronate 4-epimerase